MPAALVCQGNVGNIVTFRWCEQQFGIRCEKRQKRYGIVFLDFGSGTVRSDHSDITDGIKPLLLGFLSLRFCVLVCFRQIVESDRNRQLVICFDLDRAVRRESIAAHGGEQQCCKQQNAEQSYNLFQKNHLFM